MPPDGAARRLRALGLTAPDAALLVDALTVKDDHGAVLLVARPEADPVPALRELAAGTRLPGDAPESGAKVDK